MRSMRNFTVISRCDWSVVARWAASHGRNHLDVGDPPCDRAKGAARSGHHPRVSGRETSSFRAGVPLADDELRPMRDIRRPLLFALPVALVAGTLTGVSLASTAHAAPVVIKTLSVRADLVSGGNVLTEVVLPRGARASAVHVSLNGHDVTRQFGVRANHRYEGLLSGLRLRAHSVVAKLRDGRGAQLTITNHPIGGPAFSGPQIQPWACQSTAKDKQCNQAPSYSYYYKPIEGGTLQPYDPSNPPGDADTTTTTDGVTVPFIVRQESGYIDRDQYAIAVLWQPDKAWT